MTRDYLVDLPDDMYREHWLAFHDQVDWSAHQDVTLTPITFAGPDALYRTNKGSFMERLRPEVHCRPYVAHARRSRRSGAWVTDDALFTMSSIPALDLTGARRRGPNLGRILRRYFSLPLPTWSAGNAFTVNRSPKLRVR